MNEEKLALKLYETEDITDKELEFLITSPESDAVLAELADKVKTREYGNKVYIRGLIEISNYCKNNCLYCGIGSSNKNVKRYRLTKDEILKCCAEGYTLGFRTFVLQGGEDTYYTDEILCDIVSSIKKLFPDCAVTLSLGEREKESYTALKKAGADRYLLRHETKNADHYCYLHPENMKIEKRLECLFNLKNLGYQTGSGFMVGSPKQTVGNLIEDIRFLQKLQPEMIGIGPFIAQKDTAFANEKNGSGELTIKLVSILRLMFPKALIPATTALATLLPDGTKRALRSGANVVMPNLSPESARKNYKIYDNKAYTGTESAQRLSDLKKELEKIGLEVEISRGDAKI